MKKKVFFLMGLGLVLLLASCYIDSPHPMGGMERGLVIGIPKELSLGYDGGVFRVSLYEAETVKLVWKNGFDDDTNIFYLVEETRGPILNEDFESPLNSFPGPGDGEDGGIIQLEGILPERKYQIVLEFLFVEEPGSEGKQRSYAGISESFAVFPGVNAEVNIELMRYKSGGRIEGWESN